MGLAFFCLHTCLAFLGLLLGKSLVFPICLGVEEVHLFGCCVACVLLTFVFCVGCGLLRAAGLKGSLCGLVQVDFMDPFPCSALVVCVVLWELLVEFCDGLEHRFGRFSGDDVDVSCIVEDKRLFVCAAYLLQKEVSGFGGGKDVAFSPGRQDRYTDVVKVWGVVDPLSGANIDLAPL